MRIEDYKKISEFFKALSHPTRIAMVEELLKDKKCVRDIKEFVKVRQPNISQHLTVLKTGNIVDCVREGKTRCYFLKNPKLIKKILNMLEDMREEFCQE